MSYFLHNNAGITPCAPGTSLPPGLIWSRRHKLAQAIGQNSHHVSINLGWVLRQEDDPDGARSMFEAGLRMSRRNGDGSGLAYASLGLACLAADLGDWHRAGELHGIAQAFLDRTGQRWEQGEARYRQDSLDQVRAHLGQEQFDRAYANGTDAQPRPGPRPGPRRTSVMRGL